METVPPKSRRGNDLAIVGLAWLVVMVSLIAGRGRVAAPLLVLALPALAALRWGRLPCRGAIIACVVLAVGSVLASKPEAGSIPWGDAAVVNMMALGALIGGARVDRLAASRPEPVKGGGWMTFVVAFDRPAIAAATRTGSIPARPNHRTVPSSIPGTLAAVGPSRAED